VIPLRREQSVCLDTSARRRGQESSGREEALAGSHGLVNDDGGTSDLVNYAGLVYSLGSLLRMFAWNLTCAAGFE
jgi:hypothetical protein